jgi:hypothetical protein
VAALGSGRLLKGRLSGTPSFLMLPGSNSVQEVWIMRHDSSLVNGDCGAWVVHASKGDLFGYIVGGSANTGVAYVIPACFLFDDLQERYGGEWCLATASNLISETSTLPVDEIADASLGAREIISSTASQGPNGFRSFSEPLTNMPEVYKSHQEQKREACTDLSQSAAPGREPIERDPAWEQYYEWKYSQSPSLVRDATDTECDSTQRFASRPWTCSSVEAEVLVADVSEEDHQHDERSLFDLELGNPSE